MYGNISMYYILKAKKVVPWLNHEFQNFTTKYTRFQSSLPFYPLVYPWPESLCDICLYTFFSCSQTALYRSVGLSVCFIHYIACIYSRYCIGNDLWSFYRWPWPWTYFSRSTGNETLFSGLNIGFHILYMPDIAWGVKYGHLNAWPWSLTYFQNWQNTVLTPIHTT